MNQVDSSYDVVIVGGGITGAGILRDLALHGLKCLLIDKKDFGSQTSHMSSKMFHGGIRYMETANFGLVWEALHEKNLWLKLAPHLCKELPFYMPIYKSSKYPLWMMNLGFTLYDSLSAFQNSNHRSCNKNKTIADIPYINQNDLKGSAIYYDAIVDDCKLTLEVIFDALCESNASAKNYTELVDLKHNKSHNDLIIKNSLTGEQQEIKAKEVIFATGPFTDQVIENISDIKWKSKLLPSKGSHIWLKKESLPLAAPVVIQTTDGRIIFVIPHTDSILVGTTEEKISGNLFDLTASEKEIDYIIANLREYFPEAPITKNHILSTFAGVRPLVRIGKSNDLGKTARNHKNIHPEKNIHIIIGGKLTTFRTMGQKISAKICKRFGAKYKKGLTKTTLRRSSIVPAFEPLKSLTKEDVLKIINTEHVCTFEDLVKRRLGILTKAHWQCQKSFDQFFIEMLPELQKEIEINEEMIKNY